MLFKKTNAMKKLLLLLSVLFVVSCSKDSTVKAVFAANVEGVVQKGPFLSGTKLTIYELNEDLTQTGKSFTTTIINDTGKFSINGLSLVSDLIRINADGYYFNEVSGDDSNAQLSLSLLAKIDSNDKININVITALELPRIEYLVGNGSSFEEAKKQVQKEILKIFEIESSNLSNSELLDITKEGEGNASLLAISSIIQGYRDDAGVSELISNMATDISEDGILNSVISGSKLLSHADFLNSAKIKENLINKYEQLGKTINIPSFESLIETFITNSTFERNHSLIMYPETYNSKQNILYLNKTNYIHSDLSISQSGGYMASANADLNENAKLKIKILSKTYPTYPVGTMPPVFPKEFNWEAGDVSYDNVRLSRGEYIIEYYEMNDDLVTRTKEFKIDYDLENDYTYVPDILFERRLEYYNETDLSWDLKDKYVRNIFLENLTQLEIEEGTTFYTQSYWQIQDFTGLEKMINLNNLILNDNDAVTKIDLSTLSKLTDFDATECDNLTCIIVTQEQLDNIPSGWKKPSGAEYKLQCD
jgi:hypothetical protein